MPTQPDPRTHRRWRNLRAHILATHPNTCAICRTPIDLTLPGTHPLGPTVHHLDPIANAPHRTFDPTNLRPAHNRCNNELGTKPITTTSRNW